MPKFHITANSKEVRKGSIFFALKGAKFDGHQFIEEAIKAGASKIYSESPSQFPGVTVLGSDARKKLGEMASEAYGAPTHTLKMIGVTGTSGKTTTTYLIQHILNACGFSCARMGTNGTSFKGVENETQNTTPDTVSMQKYFSEVLVQGATHVVMEVSSHALDQDRVWGIEWDAVTFLNLSPEHMDYHSDLEDYFRAKSRLFIECAEYSRAHGKMPYLSSHSDATYGAKLIDALPGVHGYSPKQQIKNLKSTATGISAEVMLDQHWIPLHCPLFGTFQVENILAALTICTQLGVPAKKAVESLKNFPGVPGRMEYVPNNRGIFIFVDYAHKPEALEKVLQAIQGSRIICVFGCGGDRDKTKRPTMGAIAAKLSDELILTSDNPRTEDPLQILREIEAGVRAAQGSKDAKISDYQVIPDRARAITTAIESARKGDVILIAGKGHENYQIFGTEKRHFDDREEALKALKT